MNIPKNVDIILNTIEKNGFEAFVVGGCIRDSLMKKDAKDWDITTNALPHEIKEMFDHTVDTGIKHGTVTVVLKHENFEVTTYRIDGEYKDNRRPENVYFGKDIKEDLSRRDFTINAIAFNKKVGYIDPFDGIEDLKNKVIRGVGHADKRFKEDALRILRGVRFSAQLGFEIEDSTLKAIKDNAHLIQNISVERIREEFLKTIQSKYTEKMLLLKETNLIKYFLPELEYFFENFKKGILTLNLIEKEDRLHFLLGQFNERLAENILKRLKFDNKTIKEVKLTCKYLNYDFKDERIETRKLMSLIDQNILKKIILIKFNMERVENNLVRCKILENVYDEIDETIRKNHCFSLKTLSLKGDDLKILGVKNGKEIGNILNKALEFVIKFPNKNNKEDILNYLGKYIKKITLF